MVDVDGGDEAGRTDVVSMVDVELPSPMLTFASLLDKFTLTFEVLSSSILYLECKTSVGVIVVFYGSEVIIGSPILMFSCISDMFTSTSGVCFPSKFNLIEVSF